MNDAAACGSEIVAKPQDLTRASALKLSSGIQGSGARSSHYWMVKVKLVEAVMVEVVESAPVTVMV